MDPIKEVIDQKGPLRQGIPTISAVLKDGGILEMVFDPDARKTRFVLWREEAW